MSRKTEIEIVVKAKDGVTVEIPHDGFAIKGFAMVNECEFTGVSSDVPVDPAETGPREVYKGSRVIDGEITVRYQPD